MWSFFLSFEKGHRNALHIIKYKCGRQIAGTNIIGGEPTEGD